MANETINSDTLPAADIFGTEENPRTTQPCGALSALKFLCILPRGHEGEHVATGSAGGWGECPPDRVPVYDRWT